MCSKWSRLSGYRNQELYRLWLVTLHVNKIELNYYSFQMQYKVIFQAVLAFLDSYANNIRAVIIDA